MYESGLGNVGIGTVITNAGAALSVTNGNVGIGTWKPGSIYQIGNNAFTVNAAGMIAATSGITTSGGYTQSGTALNIFSGNVGINSAVPGAVLDVQGTTRILGGFNLGIGTSTPGQMLDVQGTIRTLNELVNGNVGIGTSFINGAGEGAFEVMNGNVGIGTWVPALSLDVVGTVRTKGFIYSGGTPALNYVLTALDTNGDTTWTSAGGVSGWTISSNNTDVYESGLGNVGIGTIYTTTSALTVMNGNVGIGTWKPSSIFQIGNNAFTVNAAGMIAATTGITTSGGYTQSGTAFNIFTGNVGINSAAPGAVLDVQGTTRILGGFNLGIGTSYPGQMH